LILNSNVSSTSPSGGASTASANKLVTYFVDRAREVNGASPPKRVIGTIAKELAALVKEGHSEDLLMTGIDILVDRGLDPTMISSAVFTAQARMKDGMSRADLALLNEFLDGIRADGHRWPTGSRWVRSAQAGTFVEDPLGLDQPTYDVPWSRPSKRDIVRALRERNTDEHSGTNPDRPADTAAAGT
jgi:hypothetical protein